MKLPINSMFTDAKKLQKGSFIIEAIIAIAVLSVVTISALSLSWSSHFLKPVLVDRANVLTGLIDFTSTSTSFGSASYTKWLDNFSKLIYPLGTTSPVVYTYHPVNSAFGAGTCSALFSKSSTTLSDVPYMLSASNIYGVTPTDILAKNRYVYVAADSSVAGDPDLYIWKKVGTSSVITQSATNVSSGFSAITQAGNYIYAASTGSSNQLYVIDISNPIIPAITSRLKLTVPKGATSTPISSSVAYANGKIYLGTEKWNGTEFNIIDVSNPAAPATLGGLEIGSVVKGIVINKEANLAYVSTVGVSELTTVNISNPASPRIISTTSSNGYTIESGNRMSLAHDKLWFTRVGGGFNTNNYKELFAYDVSSTTNYLPNMPISSLHVTGGVYGVAIQEPYAFVATGSSTLEVWDMDLQNRYASIALGSKPIALSCDHDMLYVALATGQLFVRITFK
jgi:hypothetical protein